LEHYGIRVDHFSAFLPYDQLDVGHQVIGRLDVEQIAMICETGACYFHVCRPHPTNNSDETPLQDELLNERPLLLRFHAEKVG